MPQYWTLAHVGRDGMYRLECPDFSGWMCSAETFDLAVDIASREVTFLAAELLEGGRSLPPPRDFGELRADSYGKEFWPDLVLAALIAVPDEGRLGRDFAFAAGAARRGVASDADLPAAKLTAGRKRTLPERV